MAKRTPARDRLSPNERISRGLATMARALTKAHAWTPALRTAYRLASNAVPQLGVTVDVSPPDEHPEYSGEGGTRYDGGR